MTLRKLKYLISVAAKNCLCLLLTFSFLLSTGSAKALFQENLFRKTEIPVKIQKTDRAGLATASLHEDEEACCGEEPESDDDINVLTARNKWHSQRQGTSSIKTGISGDPNISVPLYILLHSWKSFL